MNQRLLSACVGLAIALSINSTGCLHRYQSATCQQRGTAYSARVEKLKRDAYETLKIGTKREVVVHFFAENGIPVTFSKDEASGTIQTTGCAPSGCGSDAALLGLRVKVDESGTVVSEPVVGALYTNCL